MALIRRYEIAPATPLRIALSGSRRCLLANPGRGVRLALKWKLRQTSTREPSTKSHTSRAEQVRAETSPAKFLQLVPTSETLAESELDVCWQAALFFGSRRALTSGALSGSD